MSFYTKDGRLKGNWKVEKIREEIGKGTDVNERGYDGKPVLWHVVESHGNSNEQILEAMELLLEAGAETEDDFDGITLLISAAYWYGGTARAELLLKYGAKVNGKGRNNRTPLFWAGDLKMAKLLMEYGADINHKGDDGISCMMNFLQGEITAKKLEIAAYMLEHGGVLEVEKTELREQLQAIIFQSCYSDAMYEAKQEIIQSINRNYPELLKEWGLDLIAGRAIGQEDNLMQQYLQSGLVQQATVMIPGDVYEIPDNAFEGNEFIEEVVIHGEVRSIGNRAFYGCENLRQIVFLNNGICIVGKEAFAKCSMLHSISIPDGTWIQDRAFFDCTALQEVSFVAGDERRQKYMENYLKYYNNPRLTWEKEAFKNCVELTELKNFYVDGIGEACCLNCKKLGVVDGDICGEIGNYAFWGCDSLRRFRVAYEDWDFSGPWDTPTVKLGEYVFPYKEYEEFVFAADFEGGFYDISLYPSNVQEVLKKTPYRYEQDDYYYSGHRDNDWEDDYSWDEDAMESTAEYWDNLYAKADKYLEQLEWDVQANKVPRNVKIFTVTDPLEEVSRDTVILRYAANITEIGLASGGLYSLRFVCFDDKNKITGFAIKKVMERDPFSHSFPPAMREVEKRLDFAGSNIECIEIPPNMREISEGFRKCFQLKNVIFSSGCKTENLDGAFEESGIEQCKLPGTVTRMNSTFGNCEKLEKVDFWKEPSDLKELSDTFSKCCSLKEFLVPASVEVLGGTFEGCLSLKKIGFPEKSVLREIGYGTFRNCVQIQEIVIPQTVEKIGVNAFYGCISLRKIHILGKPVFDGKIKEIFAKCILLEEIVCAHKLEIDTSELEDVVIRYVE